LVAHGDYSSIANCWTKIPAIFRDKEINVVFALFLNVYVFTYPQLLVEALRMFVRTLVWKHCAAPCDLAAMDSV